MRRPALDPSLLIAPLSGLLMALAFPNPDLTLLAWFGLVPLVQTMHRRPFKSGFLAGVVFFAAVLYWLNIVMTTYGHLPLAVSVILYLCLVCYLALFWATATWAACRLKSHKGYPCSLTLPVFWVALEFLREFLLTGFPWATLGYSQQDWLPMIQSADLFGVYGVTYLLVLVNVVLGESFQALKAGRARSVPFCAIGFTVLLVAVNCAYGWWCLDRDLVEGDSRLKATVVQGNIDQSLKWRPENQQKTVDIYRRLSPQNDQPDQEHLLIWPEAAMPFYYQDGGPLATQVDRLAKEKRAYLLFGSPAYKAEDETYSYLNSAYLLSPEGAPLGRSDKVHLVPFGEYVPLGRFLPFVRKLVVGVGDFSPGEVRPLKMDGHRLGVLVCYEVVFPELARDYVNAGSDLLVNITNDAWFGRSSAPRQHLAMARFRAVENRVWLARAANTGISAFISPMGRIRQQTQLFEEDSLTQVISLGASPGIYTRMGDLLPGTFLLIAIAWLVQTRRKLV